jgi:SP family galactose:H+ symporter-like MFS transporter
MSLSPDASSTNERPTSFVYYAAAFAALNSANLGYDIGINASIGYRLQAEGGGVELSDVQLEAFMGVFSAFAIPGALFSYVLSDGIGRRRSFGVAAVVFIVGILVTISSSSLGVMLIGRAVMGLGVGFGSAMDPLYISELSPPQFRGQLVTWTETATNVGILLGFAAGALFERGDWVSNDAAWRIMLANGMVMPIILMLLVATVMPESPRWLIASGYHEAASGLLQKCYAPGTDIEAIVADIATDLTLELEFSKTVSWATILCRPPPYLKRMLCVGVGVAVAQQLTGIESIQYYMLYILEASGIKSRNTQFTYLLAVGALKVFVIVIAGRLFDHPRLGRRPLLMASNLGLCLALAMLMLSFLAGSHTDDDNDGSGSRGGGGNPAVAVLSLFLFVASFSLGMGPGAWLIPAEVFSLAVRAKAMSFATFCNRTVAAAAAASFLSLRSLLQDWGVILLFSLLCMGNFVFVALLVPETKGKTLEEMRDYFEKSRFFCEGGDYGHMSIQNEGENAAQPSQNEGPVAEEDSEEKPLRPEQTEDSSGSSSPANSVINPLGRAL